MWPEIIPTLVICAILVAAVVLAIMSIVKDKKKGKGCGCNCSGCAMSGACHAANNAGNNTADKNNTPDGDGAAQANSSEDKNES